MPYNRTGAALGRSFGLGNFWDDVYKTSQTVAQVADTVRQVKSGQQQVVVVPTASAIKSQLAAINWPLYLAIGGAAYFLLSRARR